MTEPSLLRGATAIGAHLGLRAIRVEHMHRARQLPTFRVPHDSAMHATAAALDDWRALPPGQRSPI